MTTDQERIKELLEENAQLKRDIASLWKPEDDREMELLVEIADLKAKISTLEAKDDPYASYRYRRTGYVQA